MIDYLSIIEKLLVVVIVAMFTGAGSLVAIIWRIWYLRLNDKSDLENLKIQLEKLDAEIKDTAKRGIEITSEIHALRTELRQGMARIEGYLKGLKGDNK